MQSVSSQLLIQIQGSSVLGEGLCRISGQSTLRVLSGQEWLNKGYQRSNSLRITALDHDLSTYGLKFARRGYTQDVHESEITGTEGELSKKK